MITQPRYYRKIIRIRAEDSPNVRLALAQIERGEKPTGEVIVPGVLTWHEYQKRRKLWDKVQQTVSLDGIFYKGEELLLFSEDMLNRSKEIANELSLRGRRAEALGVDAAEGGDDTVWTVIDRKGVILQQAYKTKDTSNVPGTTIGLMKDYGIAPEQVCFDRGGGGKQHADYMRKKGYKVRTVGFGEAAGDAMKDYKTSTIKAPVAKRVEATETVYSFKNRRAEMYWMIAQLIKSEMGFAIHSNLGDLLHQLSPMPKLYDAEGRLYLPPKDKPNENFTGQTIKQMLGRSPDHADSLAVAVFAMLRKPHKARVGAG